jgi:hypothetical protein
LGGLSAVPLEIMLTAHSCKPGTDLRLAAAQVLLEKPRLIMAGEPPYHVFVRWKPLSQQAIGRNPDGTRMGW